MPFNNLSFMRLSELITVQGNYIFKHIQKMNHRENIAKSSTKNAS